MLQNHAEVIDIKCLVEAVLNACFSSCMEYLGKLTTVALSGGCSLILTI